MLFEFQNKYKLRLSVGLPWWHSSVQLLSRVQLFATPWTAALPGLPAHHRLLEFTQTHVH